MCAIVTLRLGEPHRGRPVDASSVSTACRRRTCPVIEQARRSAPSPNGRRSRDSHPARSRDVPHLPWAAGGRGRPRLTGLTGSMVARTGRCHARGVVAGGRVGGSVVAGQLVLASRLSPTT